jgi:hypothetical protein
MTILITFTKPPLHPHSPIRIPIQPTIANAKHHEKRKASQKKKKAKKGKREKEEKSLRQLRYQIIINPH